MQNVCPGQSAVPSTSHYLVLWLMMGQGRRHLPTIIGARWNEKDLVPSTRRFSKRERSTCKFCHKATMSIYYVISRILVIGIFGFRIWVDLTMIAAFVASNPLLLLLLLHRASQQLSSVRVCKETLPIVEEYLASSGDQERALSPLR